MAAASAWPKLCASASTGRRSTRCVAGVVVPVSRGVYRLGSLDPLAHPDLVTVAKRIPQGVLCLIASVQARLQNHARATKRPFQLLDFPAPALSGYPRETVVAEKFQAMVDLRTLNSRMKDFYDVRLLARQFAFDGAVLAKGISKVTAPVGDVHVRTTRSPHNCIICRLPIPVGSRA